MTVPSSAAIVHVTVSPVVLQKDIVLATLLHAVSPLQVQVQLDKKIPLQLRQSAAVVLKQRNAVVRALIGTGLQGALDMPWAAGHWGRRHASSTSAMLWASFLYWMALKEPIFQQQQGSDKINEITSELARQLEEHAFLVPCTAVPTVADYDVALALVQSNTEITNPNTVRWMKTTLASFQQMVESCHNPAIPSVSLPASVSKYLETSPAVKIPAFFDGTEDVAAVLQQLHHQTSNNKPQQRQKDDTLKANKQQHQQQQHQQQAGKSKKEKKKQQQQTKQPVQATTDFDISALDIRVGRIVKIWPHETADKLYCEDIDMGNGEVRQVASGLRQFYPNVADLAQQKVLVLANLKKRNLVGFPSHGMVLCASNADHSKVELVVPPADASLGERVWFGGATGESDNNKQKDPEPENKVQKKKLTELLLPDLKTNEHGIVGWKGEPAQTSAGVVKAVNGMTNAQVS